MPPSSDPLIVAPCRIEKCDRNHAPGSIPVRDSPVSGSGLRRRLELFCSSSHGSSGAHDLGDVISVPSMNAAEHQALRASNWSEMGHVQRALGEIRKRKRLNRGIFIQVQCHGFRAARAEPEIFCLPDITRVKLRLYPE